MFLRKYLLCYLCFKMLCSIIFKLYYFKQVSIDRLVASQHLIKLMIFVLWMLTLMVYRNRIITFDNKSFVCTARFDIVVYIGLFSFHKAYSNRQLGEYIHDRAWIRTLREDRNCCRNRVPRQNCFQQLFDNFDGKMVAIVLFHHWYGWR